MIDYTRFDSDNLDLAEITAGQSPDDLRQMVNEMVEAQLKMMSNCRDADVTFVPIDEEADDPAAGTEDETSLAWTLGHVIVHCCASAEESTFLASELARGVPNHGRSRHEPHWTTIKTLQQCREALQESRRMRLATLDVWPKQPNLINSYEVWPGGPVANALQLFVFGHVHEYSHFGQVQEIVRQAQDARR